MIVTVDGTIDSSNSFTAARFQDERQIEQNARWHTLGFITASSALLLWRAAPVSDS